MLGEHPPFTDAVRIRFLAMAQWRTGIPTNDAVGAGAQRQCSRPGCSEAAAATLTYHYDRSQAWLDELSERRDPHSYDLCERHAARISVPHGWHLDDRRDNGLGTLIAV